MKRSNRPQNVDQAPLTAVKLPEKRIAIPHEEPTVLLVTIEGTAPLLQNPKTRTYLEEIKAAGHGGRKSGMSKKGAMNPEREFQERLRPMKQGYGHPTEAFTGNEGLLVKALSLVAARKMKLSKDTIKGAVRVIPDEIMHTPEGVRGFVRINGRPEPMEHSASVQSGKVRVPIWIIRPMFREWSMQLRVEFNPLLVGEEQLLQLLVRGGASFGLGAYRREKGGEFGTFKVVSAAMPDVK
jgi:hypothetical protein